MKYTKRILGYLLIGFGTGMIVKGIMNIKGGNK